MVKEVSPTAPNAQLIKPNDVIVGINGQRFNPPIRDRDTFHKAIGLLKHTPRPMVVMVERWVIVVENVVPVVVVAVAPPAEEDVDDIPLHLLKQRQQQHRKRENLSDNDDDDDEDEEEDSSEGEDDIDWYDAKIISHDNQTQQFVVHFLGDEIDKTYTMALAPKIVRPSVRAWMKRSLGLIYCNEIDYLLDSSDNGKKKKKEDGSLFNYLEDCLSPSTNLPDDAFEIEKLMQEQQQTNVGGGAATKNNGAGAAANSYQNKILEYKRLLAKQQYLAARLHPHDDDDDEDKEEGEEDGDDSPGPLAHAFYVKHLCHCMKEIEKACDWLMGESVAISMLSKLKNLSPSSVAEQTSTAPAAASFSKVTQDVIHSFLIHGSKHLNACLLSDPSDKEAAAAVADSKKRKGRNKRRRTSLTSSGVNSGRTLGDADFHAAQIKALVSNDSLDKLLCRLLKTDSTPITSLLQQQKMDLVTCTLTQSLTTLHTRVWKPVTEWIAKSEDMINGTSSQFYTLLEVETHFQMARNNDMALALVDLSSWTDKLVAKLSRARLFEMEAWNAVKACISQPVAAGGNGGSTTGCEDGCILALQHLQSEASSSSSSGVAVSAVDHPMRNLNPLGRHQTVSSSGLTMPSSLTRTVLQDAITVREWILDLTQAKTFRERTSFVQVSVALYIISAIQTPMFACLAYM